MIDRAAFYASVRKSLFGGRLSQSQIDGMNDLLEAWEVSGFTDLRWLAYIFGGVYAEVGKRMVPVREGFASTDAGARAAVAKLYASGRISRNYALPVGGVSYYGRGRIQNTHYDNYLKLQNRFGYPFVKQPDLLLESKIDAIVTVRGHAEGIWTGKKLGDYFTPTRADWTNARRIVNGTDRAAEIAGYAKKFYEALFLAEAAAGQKTPPAVPPPPPVTPAPVPVETAPRSLWAWLVNVWRVVIG